MRISTSTIYDLGVSAITRQQSALLQTQQQLATGRRVVTPADDPIAAANALQVTQTDAVNTQFSANRQAATSQLGSVNEALTQFTDLLQKVRTIVVAAGNPTLSANDRATYAGEVQGHLNDLIGIANSTDSQGAYLFAGFQSNTQPFANGVAGVQYLGDSGARQVQVAPSLNLAVSAAGNEVFERIRTGNGVLTTQANAANSGTGVITTGSVANPALLTGDNYRVTFTVVGSTVTYGVDDLTQGTTVAAGLPYTSGGIINFDGIQFQISGTPANGDQFTVAPSTNQSVFKTLADLVAALQVPTSGGAAGAALTNNLNTASTNIDQALNHGLQLLGAVGGRLNELDGLNNAGDSLGLLYKQTLSQLQDVDTAKAASDLSRQQLILQAAQKSFVAVAGLSLFSYI